MKKNKEYAIYKGEDLIMIGTVKEIAKHLEIKEKSVLFYQTPTYLKRHRNSKKQNYKILIKIEED